MTRERVSFTRAELEAQRGRSVPDLVGDDVRLLFVGINPGLWTAATQTHFAHPGNRFYPALYRAGITAHEIDGRSGFTEEDRAHLTGRGVAITNVVAHATARADELDDDDYRAGAETLVEKVARWRPRVVCFVGIGAYRIAFGRRKAVKGRQADAIHGAEIWALGNPSGLNAHETVDSLAKSYRDVALAAGVDVDPPRWGS